MAFIQMDYMAESIQRWTTSWVLFPMEEKPRPLKAVILLPDAGGNHTDFVTKYGARQVSEESGLILIMPDGDNSSFMDYPVYAANYETYIARELPSLMRRAFSFGRDKDDLALMGVGEGGKAAERIAAKYPEVFGRGEDITKACREGGKWLC